MVSLGHIHLVRTHPRLERREGPLGHGQVTRNLPILSDFLTGSSLSLSPSRFYPVSRRVPEYYSPYSSQYPDDYQYYPPGVRPDSICSMPAYDRISPPWALEDKRHSFRNGGGPAFQLREWKEPAGYGRPDGTVWIPSPSRQPVYYDELEAASGSLRRLSLQPRSHSVPRSPGQGSYGRGRVYSPARSPRAHFERLPPRSEDIYTDPAAYVMRRSISSPKVSPPPSPPSSAPEVPWKPEAICQEDLERRGRLGTLGPSAGSAGPKMPPGAGAPGPAVLLGGVALPLGRNTSLCAPPQAVPGALMLYKRTQTFCFLQTLRTWTDHCKHIAVDQCCPFSFEICSRTGYSIPDLELQLVGKLMSQLKPHLSNPLSLPV